MFRMLTPLFWVAAGLAVVNWTSVARMPSRGWWNRLLWISKPAAMLALIAWFLSLGGWRMPLLLFAAGMLLSLLGDILLLLPDRYFLSGVAAFLLAHVCYIAVFLQGPLPPPWLWLAPILLVGAVFAALVRRLRAGLAASGQQAMFVPVLVYALVLSVMWAAALSTPMRPNWLPAAALLCSLGGSLFFFSDAVLAFSRFVRPIRSSGLLVMVTYHSGQALLAAGMLLQYATAAV